jgi:thiol:disulfide interchange protein DsbA
MRARLRLLLLPFAVLAAGAIAAPATPRSGFEYHALPTPQPTDSGNKVELTLFFDYACPHCNSFEPLFMEWVRKQGNTVRLKRVHIGRPNRDLPQQRLFYTLESMGLLEAWHDKVFAAIHGPERASFVSDAAVLEWVEKAGINRAAFATTSTSPGVEVKLRRARALMDAYRIDRWPTVAVNGRYLTSPTLASEHVGMELSEVQQQQYALLVLDALLAKARADIK